MCPIGHMRTIVDVSYRSHENNTEIIFKKTNNFNVNSNQLGS